MVSVAGTYAVEQHGPQEHRFASQEFVDRFNRAFVDYAGAVSHEWLEAPVPRERAERCLATVTLGG
jgi:hypothetical protein